MFYYDTPPQSPYECSHETQRLDWLDSVVGDAKDLSTWIISVVTALYDDAYEWSDTYVDEQDLRDQALNLIQEWRNDE